MTKKDYIKIADAISNAHSFKHEGIDTAKLIENLTKLFQEDNNRFDSEKFLEACEMKSTNRGIRYLITK
tara:strand:+ start:131 stop:337 length:207 start_codon:yes stop_codon:yes gene_type:complete